MFSYLMGNVNGLLAQMNLEENIKSQQTEALEDWLIKLNRVGKNKRIKNKDTEFVTDYMKSYWVHDIKNIAEGSDFMRQLPPTLRRKVPWRAHSAVK